MMVMGANDNKSPSNTLYSRHSLSHRDSPIITEYARSPREDAPPPPFTLDVTGGRRRREEGSCQVDAEWQKSCEPDKRVSKSSIHPLSLLFHLISPIHKCHLAPKNSSQRQRRRPPPQSDGSAARLPSGKKQPISSARSVSPCQLGICENPSKNWPANQGYAGCRRIQNRQQVARVRPGLRKVRLWYTIYMSMYT